jgi:NAD(P)-dependent dehydrogenase (short-subunit alcohol dehydrogenase family)
VSAASGYATRMSNHHPRLAIVTGSDSGIGQATATLLASEGFDVGLTFHSDEEGIRATADEVARRGQRAFVEPFDASSPDAGAVVDRLADHDGPFLCSQHAARRMLEQGAGGRIINVTSVHEHLPRLGAAAYCAAKAGLGMFTKVLALELAEHGITVNAVAPGEISTPMTGQDESDAYHQARPGNPLGRPGHVAEVASVIGFLASPRSAYVTGSSYTVDGGLSLMAAHGHDSATGWREP